MFAGLTNSGLTRSRHTRPSQPRAITTPAEVAENDESQKFAILDRLSAELNCTVVENRKLGKFLAHAILRRLRMRGENFLYQSVAFSIPNFPRSYAQRIFPAESVIENSTKVQTWRLESMSEVSSSFGQIFAMTRHMAFGCLRGEFCRASAVGLPSIISLFHFLLAMQR